MAPIPASSGKTTRHWLHRGGDRSGNRALHIARRRWLRYDWRTAQGKSLPEIIRCQKRYLAGEVAHRPARRQRVGVVLTKLFSEFAGAGEQECPELVDGLAAGP